MPENTEIVYYAETPGPPRPIRIVTQPFQLARRSVHDQNEPHDSDRDHVVPTAPARVVESSTRRDLQLGERGRAQSGLRRRRCDRADDLRVVRSVSGVDVD